MNDEQRPDELDRKLDVALDALNTGQPPTDDPSEEELEELLDAARLVRRLRESEWPDESYPGLLAEQLAVELSMPAEDGATNNHQSVTALPPIALRPRPRRVLLALLAALVRTTGALVVAGMLAGMLAGGIGGRLAMRASGALYEREHPGEPLITESSSTPVGQISLQGTIDLLIEGLFAGFAGALLYLGVRRWLPGRGRWRGAVFGLFGLLLAGTAFITSDNQDFARIGNPMLNVAMFAAIFILFGMLIVPLAQRLERFIAPRANAPVWRRAARWPVLLVGGLTVAFVVVELPFLLVTLVSELTQPLREGFDTRDNLTTAIALLALLVLPVATVLSASSARATLSQLPWRSAQRLLVDDARLSLVGRAALAVATLLGIYVVGSEIVAILTAG